MQTATNTTIPTHAVVILDQPVLVWGIGPGEDAAWADAKRWADNLNGAECWTLSPTAGAFVASGGDATRLTYVERGTVCTPEERREWMAE